MNGQNIELTFCELRSKEVVNATDGKRLGRIVDIVFSGESGKIKGIVTPYGRQGIFAKSQDMFIPWRCVTKIGEDVIIVCLNENGTCAITEKEEKDECKEGRNLPKCDGRCEKCMLFDCEHRWKK